MNKLWKTTIVIWTEYDPQRHEIDDLAVEACYGDAYCSKSEHRLIERPDLDCDWDGTEFFEIMWRILSKRKKT
jgi:hypothetical protein